MGKNGSPAVGGRTAAAAAATVADATIGLAGLVVAMVMTGATPGKLEISNGGGVEAVVDLGGARWITVEPCCWLDSWVCSDNSGIWRGGCGEGERRGKEERRGGVGGRRRGGVEGRKEEGRCRGKEEGRCGGKEGERGYQYTLLKTLTQCVCKLDLCGDVPVGSCQE